MKLRYLVYLAGFFLTTIGRADVREQILGAARPIDEGVPEVAVTQLQKMTPFLSGNDLILAKQKLAEAFVAAGQSAQALQLLNEPALAQNGEVRLLRADALAQLGRFADALALYRAAAADQNQHNAALFGAAEMLRGLGKIDEAEQNYRALRNDARFGASARLREAELLVGKGEAPTAKRLLDTVQPKLTTDKRVKRLLRARVELLEYKPEKAAPLLEALVKKPDGASRPTIIAALFALADAHLQLRTPESGDDFLEDFVERHPNDPELPKVFAKLDELYRAERKPVRSELEKWARDPAQPRRGFARWYLAKMELRAGRTEEAFRQFQEIRNSAPLPSELAPALLQYARLQIDAGKFSEARATLEAAEKSNPAMDLRAEIEFEAGRADAGARKFSEAAAQFENIGRSASGLRAPALFNASLAWLQANDATKFQAVATTVADEGSDLALEQGLAAAQRNDRSAAGTLRDFVRRFPNHQRVAEAYLALAELAFHSAPPKLEEAEKNLSAAKAAHPSAVVAETIDYLAIWLADARDADSDGVISAATHFLHDHPQSSVAPEVRMKVAETHFRRQDFANAQTQFETLAQENPKSPLSEKALFFAAQSAAASMANHSLEHALELLTQVVKMEGDLRWAARNEQAAIERRLGKAQDAQVLYDEVLKGDARSADKREALCGKADTFFEQANTDVSNLARASTLYDQLAGEASNQPHWRNQALFKKGVCQQKQSDPAGALATFYRILEFNPIPDKTPEFFWFYKAGFNAARLLEEQQRWNSAAAVYEKLVAANGPRREEAQARLTQLRLEHFLWQD